MSTRSPTPHPSRRSPPSAHHEGAPSGVGRLAVRPRDHAAGGRRLVRQARPAPDGPQPGDVRRRGRQRPHDDPVLPGPAVGDGSRQRVRRARRRVAVVHRAVRQLRRGGGRGRGKAQADTLRKTRSETVAHVRQRRRHDRREAVEPSSQVGDLCVVVAGELIPGDGEIIEGIASVDESAITGESAPVIRESGGDRSAVTGGTRVLSDQIVVRITSKPGETFLDRMIALVEGRRAGRRRRTRSRSTSCSPGSRSSSCSPSSRCSRSRSTRSAEQSITVLVALLVCLIPTTIGALLSAIGIAGMDRLVQRNVLAMSGRAVEAAGDCSTLLLDKTGTITYGNRQAAEFLPLPRRRRARRWPTPRCSRAWPTRRPRAARS